MPADQSITLPTTLSLAAPFEVQYVPPSALPTLMASQHRPILGVVAFGGDRQDAVEGLYPFARTSVDPIDEAAMLEVWTTTDPVTYHRLGTLKAAQTERICFGSISVEQSEGQALESLVQDAYDTVLMFLGETSFPAPIRFWNYLPFITEDDRGLERYRRFNIGRHEAFAARLDLPSPPVASALGGHAGSIVIYFLAAREPALTIENPRQVSAYAYPPIYGPRRPLFSRSAIFSGAHAPYFLISGTASIVGHESRHPGDVDAQTFETLANVRALVGEAERLGFPPVGKSWFFKIYVRHPEHLARIRDHIGKTLGPTDHAIYLRADICRPELLLELEGICISDAKPV
jgi:chorismate lyase/3-hydroxybenzoate synthase